MSRFLDRLANGPTIVGDGGVGALVSDAVPGLRCPEEANLRAPESVVSLHVAYIAGGAELIQTNTFGASRPKLARLYLEDEFERINSTGVRLAREAREVSGGDVFIAGSIGPLGPEVDLRRHSRADLFAEQASVLEGRGADLFTLETFYDLDELVTAVGAVREVSGLPIVALLTFDQDGRTLTGISAREAADRLVPMDLAAIGANHGTGPAAALTALEQMQRDGLALAALPNVGLATLSGSRIVYPHATPDYFAEFAAQARSLGAAIVGGCCGTTPAQIAAIRSAIDEERRPQSRLVTDVLAQAAPRAKDRAETELARMLRAGEWVVSVQLDPPLGGDNRALLDVARALKDSGRAHMVDVNDNPRARARMSGMMASVAIERDAGIETIPHLTPRDTSIAGLESLLLGAHAEGVRNVLAVTGDPPELGDYPGAGGVYEIDSIGLVDVMARLNRGEDHHGRTIDGPTSFFPGVAVNPTADDLDRELERFHQKVAAGAVFAMTQILFELSYLERFLERLGGASPIPMLVGIWPLRSHALALRLHNEVPGIVVPEAVQDRLARAGTGAVAAGAELARELMEGSRDLAAGVYVVAPFRQPLAALELI